MPGVLVLVIILCMTFPWPLPAPVSKLVSDGGKAGKLGGGSAWVGTPTSEVLTVVAVAAAIVA